VSRNGDRSGGRRAPRSGARPGPRNGAVNGERWGDRSGCRPAILLFGQRARARALARQAVPRRGSCRLVSVRSAEEFATVFRSTLVDGALIDVGGATEETWRATALATEFPSVPFFAILPLRLTDGPALARCAELELSDVLIDGVDDAVTAAYLGPRLFSARFEAGLREPPAILSLATPLQREAWRHIVARSGRAVRTTELARALGVTREHLSRTFSAEGAPNLKRVIDLVRLLAAAELAKNPGYDIRDVAHVLGFASSSHLSSCAQRLVGTRPSSLARLRSKDLLERFAQGRGRSRA